MSQVRRVLAVGLATVLAGGALSQTAVAAPRTLYVGQCHGASPYTAVQSAVDAADDGTTVSVCPGSYPGQVRISDVSGLTLEAPQGAVVGAPNLLGTVVQASSSPGLRVQGLTLRSVTSAVYVTSSPGTALVGNQVDVGGDGLVLLDSPRSTVKANAITLDQLDGIIVSRGDGSKVSDNTVGGGQIGLAVFESRGVRVLDNALDGRDQDAVDNSSGKATAGTANRWRGNTCDTSDPAGLCAAR